MYHHGRCAHYSSRWECSRTQYRVVSGGIRTPVICNKPIFPFGLVLGLWRNKDIELSHLLPWEMCTIIRHDGNAAPTVSYWHGIILSTNCLRTGQRCAISVIPVSIVLLTNLAEVRHQCHTGIDCLAYQPGRGAPSVSEKEKVQVPNRICQNENKR
jgi:hypothetical protein